MRRPTSPNSITGALVTDDGQYILVVSSKGTDERFGLTLHPVKGGKAITLVDDYANNWEYVTNQGTRFTFTNKDAPRQRLVSLDIRKALRR